MASITGAKGINGGVNASNCNKEASDKQTLLAKFVINFSELNKIRYNIPSKRGTFK